jgi:DNA-binding transcriptional LysR family regulator
LHLSERGKIIYKYAREIFDRGDELLGVVDRGELSATRELYLGAQSGVPKAIISETVVRLHRKTKAKIRVLEGSAPQLLDQLLEGKADLILFDHELTHTAGSVTYLLVGEERIAFWGTKEFSELKNKFPESLSKAPMVLSSTGHPLRQSVESFFVTNGLSLNIVAEAPDTALIKELGRGGLGMVALGERTVRAWARAGVLHKIGSLRHTQRYVLGLPKRMLKDPLAEFILKEFK